MKRNNRDFSKVQKALIILGVCLFGFIGWYVYKQSNKTTQGYTPTPSAQTTQ